MSNSHTTVSMATTLMVVPDLLLKDGTDPSINAPTFPSCK